MMKPTQNVHLQLTTEIKPDMIGPKRGPKVPACEHQQTYKKDVIAQEHTAINMAIARPLVTGSLRISAYTPPTTDIGHAALIPTISLNINSAGQFGATAHASVNIVNKLNVPIMILFLP